MFFLCKCSGGFQVQGAEAAAVHHNSPPYSLALETLPAAVTGEVCGEPLDLVEDEDDSVDQRADKFIECSFGRQMIFYLARMIQTVHVSASKWVLNSRAHIPQWNANTLEVERHNSSQLGTPEQHPFPPEIILVCQVISCVVFQSPLCHLQWQTTTRFCTIKSSNTTSAESAAHIFACFEIALMYGLKIPTTGLLKVTSSSVQFVTLTFLIIRLKLPTTGLLKETSSCVQFVTLTFLIILFFIFFPMHREFKTVHTATLDNVVIDTTPENHIMLGGHILAVVQCSGCHKELGRKCIQEGNHSTYLYDYEEGKFGLNLKSLLFWDGNKMLEAKTLKPWDGNNLEEWERELNEDDLT
ncbi:hypothetical protein WN943_026469 [Citrus x changshan-huyou]